MKNHHGKQIRAFRDVGPEMEKLRLKVRTRLLHYYYYIIYYIIILIFIFQFVIIAIDLKCQRNRIHLSWQLL
jgi:hypothetical protein